MEKVTELKRRKKLQKLKRKEGKRSKNNEIHSIFKNKWEIVRIPEEYLPLCLIYLITWIDNQKYLKYLMLL